MPKCTHSVTIPMTSIMYQQAASSNENISFFLACWRKISTKISACSTIFVVLSEIASRALSSAVNDPGTAIHVIGVGLRVLMLWPERSLEEDSEKPMFPAVHVRALAVADMFEDFFMPIARDGATGGHDEPAS